jgi:hypothetical protein
MGFANLGGVSDISPDGKTVIYGEARGVTAMRIEGTAQERQPRAVIEAGEQAWSPRFSPDGRWIVYYLTQNPGIYAEPFPGPGLRTQIANSGRYPIWRGDGKEILYLDQGRLWSLRVERVGSDLRFGMPEPLFHVNVPAGFVSALNPLSVNRDGSRIYFPQAAEQPESNSIHVMTGIWP